MKKQNYGVATELSGPLGCCLGPPAPPRTQRSAVVVNLNPSLPRQSHVFFFGVMIIIYYEYYDWLLLLLLF